MEEKKKNNHHDDEKKPAELIWDAAQKDPELQNPLEIQRATEEDYIKELEWCALHAEKQAACRKSCDKDKCAKKERLSRPFFIEVLTKREKLLNNTLRNYFVAKQKCPAPIYDQAVYQFDGNEIKFIWVVPDKEVCKYYIHHKDQVVPEERALLNNVFDFYDSSLYERMKKLNGEKMQIGYELEKN